MTCFLTAQISLGALALYFNAGETIVYGLLKYGEMLKASRNSKLKRGDADEVDSIDSNRKDKD